MSIADKLTQIAENVTKVYEAGQKSMVDESKIIEKTVSGSVISLDDVSEVPHEVSVQLSSDTVTDFSDVVVNVFGQNIFSNVVAASLTNVLTNINSVTYSLTPNMADGKTYGIRADVSTLPLEIGDVLKCSVKSISKIGTTYGWRVEYQDGTYNRASNSLNATLTVDKPFKALLLYCDLGVVGFSYEPVVFTDVVVYKESDVTKYTANSDGSVNVKSISPYMTITTDTADVNISATYHKSWGMQSEYDRLTLEVTNNMTVNNTRVHYTNIFSYGNWGGFKFAYPIKPTGNIAQMFYNSPMTELPTPLDFSEIMTKASANSYTYRRGVFGYCSNLKEIDFSAETGINMRAIDGLEEWFTGCRKLETIKGLNVHEGTIFNTDSGSSAFYLCDALVNISFAEESVIGNSLDIHWSTRLSSASYYDIIRHLSPTITGCILTVPKNARESYDATNGEGSWDMTLQMWCPSNWTIAYA